MFGTKISRLQKKSSGLMNTFTLIVDGLKDANIKITKELENVESKKLKLSEDSDALFNLQQSNHKAIANITKIIQ